jgi:hypothetical protein
MRLTKQEELLFNGLLMVALILSIFLSGYFIGRMVAYAMR